MSETILTKQGHRALIEVTWSNISVVFKTKNCSSSLHFLAQVFLLIPKILLLNI